MRTQEGCQVINKVKPWKWQLTSALLNGGWVPQTSRSFHYWQSPPWGCSHGWQILVTWPWAPMQKGRTAPELCDTTKTSKGGRGGEATQKPFSIAERRYNEHAICTWTEDRPLHRLTNISSKHVLAYAQRNTAKRTDPSAPQKHRWAWGNTNIGECTGACA